MKWSKVSKKITWKNQLNGFPHDDTETLEEVKKKASAWFRVTYEPWILYMKKYRKDKKKKQTNMNNQQTRQQQQQREYFKGLFSFAWIVYPVLLEIFDEKNEEFQAKKETKKKKKKTKNKKKDQSNNTSDTTHKN